MTESMKFGPEWLRNLSEIPVQPPVRYQLAEHRYGREEMLALFSPNLTPPKSLKQLTSKGIYVEKAQPPLTLTTMTDEETRMWNRGINSDMVPRSAGKGEGRGGLRGSGGGRGRGRGGGGPYYSGRGGGGGSGPVGGYGDDLDCVPGGGSGSGGGYGGRPSRPFERSQSERERGRDSWSDRNGGEGRGGGGNRNSEGNWRRTRGGGGDEDDWRPSKWSTNSVGPYSRTSGNWRDEESWDIGSNSKGNHHLPEWATEKTSEGGGTFDSSGAFRTAEMATEEEEEMKKIELKQQCKQPPDAAQKTLINKTELEQPETQPLENSKQEQQSNHIQTTNENQNTLATMDSGDPPQSPPLAQPLKQQQLHHQPQQQQHQPQQQQHQPQQQQSQSVQNQVSSTTPIPNLNSQPKQHSSPAPLHIPNMSTTHTNQLEVEQSDLQLDDSLGHMTDDLAADLVAKLMEDEDKKGKQWFYRDPQGEIQGPFSCSEMAEWFQSGYFKLNLLVRRACDPHYAPLGELIRLWGCIPFLPDQHPMNLEGALINNQQQIKEQILMNQYQQQCRIAMLRQQATRTQLANKVPHDWLDSSPHQMFDQVLPPQYQPHTHPFHHLLNNTNLRALLAHMQQQQTLNAQQPQQPTANAAFPPPPPHLLPHQMTPQQQGQLHGKPSIPPPRTTEEISRKVSDFLRGLQAKSEQQAAAAAAAAAAATATGNGGNSGTVSQGGLMESLIGGWNSQSPQQGTPPPQLSQPPPPPPAQNNTSTAIQNLLRQMQATHQNKMHHNPNVESVWNGNWNQWNHLNPKGIKTEQEVLDEQLRAEGERVKEELRKQEEVKRHQEVAEEEEKQQLNIAREVEELSRRHQEEEDLRRKQEASRRAEVERQRKGEEKRKKDEEKRKKEEEKKERERLREEERKKKEAEEAKKKAGIDVMAKVQRSQWCAPAPSSISLLDIQKNEMEQQHMRGLQAQQQQQKEVPKLNSGGMSFKWIDTPRPTPQVEMLVDIQAEQLGQFMKQLEKEKQSRDKEKVNSNISPALGSWSQGLTWGSGLITPAWQGVNPLTKNSSSNSGGFWEQMSSPPAGSVGGSKPSPGAAPPAPHPISSRTSSSSPSLNAAPGSGKEPKCKQKREELSIIKLFSNCHNDEFTQWCTSALSNMQSTVDIPTFVGFLRDVESTAEVQEYVREYLGEEKEATDFAKQFIERRKRISSTDGGSGGVANLPQQINQTSTAQSNSHQHSSSREDFQQVKVNRYTLW